MANKHEPVSSDSSRVLTNPIEVQCSCFKVSSWFELALANIIFLLCVLLCIAMNILQMHTPFVWSQCMNYNFTQVQFITTMSVEIHIRSRHGLKPDPEWDPVLVVFYHIHNDWSTDGWHSDSKVGVIAIDLNSGSVDIASPAKRKSPNPSTPVKQSPNKHTPVKQSPLKVQSPAKRLLGQSSGQCGDDIVADDDVTRPYLNHCGLSPNIEVTYVQSEKCLFDELVELVRQYDPDILLAYNMERESWGYLIDRSRFLSINLIDMLGRIPSNRSKERNIKNPNHIADTYVIGRIILNLWRIVKNEVCFMLYNSYTQALT